MVATMRRYLDQCALSLRLSSVTLFDTTLRQFAATLIGTDPPVRRVRDIRRERVLVVAFTPVQGHRSSASSPEDRALPPSSHPRRPMVDMVVSGEDKMVHTLAVVTPGGCSRGPCYLGSS
ncbi:MAG: hypothetical protein ACREQM_19275 [Candidatus Dormibacteraceae bacterium]